MSNPTRQEIFQNLSQVFNNVFSDEVELSEATTANDIDEWDSLNHLQLMMAVEKRFGVSFRAAEINSLKSVGDLVTLLQSKIR